MNWNVWIRQVHRWLSILFTGTVIANFVAMGLWKPPAWVVYSPLPPLLVLLFTGLYMFVRPYTTKWRSGKYAEQMDRVLLGAADKINRKREAPWRTTSSRSKSPRLN